MVRAAGGLAARAIDLGVRCQVFIAMYLAASSAYLSAALIGAIAWRPVAATFLISWQVYAADRFVIHPEDLAGTDEDLDRVRFLRRHRRAFQALFVAAVGGELLLVVMHPRLAGGLVLGVGLGLLYVVEIPLLRMRLKHVPFAKTLYVPFVAVATMLLLLGRLPRDHAAAVPVVGMYLLMVLNTTVFDIKDRENDRRAGIKTIANTFAVRSVVRAIQLACLVAALGLMLFDPGPPAVALGLSFWAFAGLLWGLTAERERSGRFYFGLLDVVLALPLLFLALVRLVL